MGQLRSHEEFINWKPPEIKLIIEQGILPVQGAMMIYGVPKSWKSMMGQYTAYKLAQAFSGGATWIDFKTTPAVVYVMQSELPEMMFHERYTQYHSANKVDTKLPIYNRTEPYIKLDTGYGLSLVEKDLQLIKLKHPDENLVLIFDPVYMLLTGNISDPQDVGRFLSNINLLRANYKAAVILIHHESKAIYIQSGKVNRGIDAIFGSAAFGWWCDTAVEINLVNPASSADTVDLQFTLVRNAKKSWPGRYLLRWNKETLQPHILKKIAPVTEDSEITVKLFDEKLKQSEAGLSNEQATQLNAVLAQLNTQFKLGG